MKQANQNDPGLPQRGSISNSVYILSVYDIWLNIGIRVIVWLDSPFFDAMIFIDAMFYWIKTIVKIGKILFKTFYMVMFLCVKGTIW